MSFSVTAAPLLQLQDILFLRLSALLITVNCAAPGVRQEELGVSGQATIPSGQSVTDPSPMLTPSTVELLDTPPT